MTTKTYTPTLDQFDAAVKNRDIEVLVRAYLATMRGAGFWYFLAPRKAKESVEITAYCIPSFSFAAAAALAEATTLTTSSEGKTQLKFGEGSHRALKAAAHAGSIGAMATGYTVGDLDALANGPEVEEQRKAARDRYAAALEAGDEQGAREAANAATAKPRGITCELLAARWFGDSSWSFDGQRYDQAGDVLIGGVEPVQVKLTRGTERVDTIREALAELWASCEF